jgi:hypothetical protein
MTLIFIALLISHLEISGRDFKDAQPPKMQFILFIFLVSQFDISGIDCKDEQPSNKHVIWANLGKFHLEMSFGKEIKEEHPPNK